MLSPHRRLHLRRHDHSPRVELLPLIDVIFLLLTFFIYSLILTVRAEILPVQLVPVSGGTDAEPGHVAALTVDAGGRLFFDRQPVSLEALPAALEAFAAQDDPPPLFVALEVAPPGDGDIHPDDVHSIENVAKTPTDRGPLVVHLIEMLRDAGIEDVSIVGPPRGSDRAAATGPE